MHRPCEMILTDKEGRCLQAIPDLFCRPRGPPLAAPTRPGSGNELLHLCPIRIRFGSSSNRSVPRSKYSSTLETGRRWGHHACPSAIACARSCNLAKPEKRPCGRSLIMTTLTPVSRSSRCPDSVEKRRGAACPAMPLFGNSACVSRQAGTPVIAREDAGNGPRAHERRPVARDEP